MPNNLATGQPPSPLPVPPNSIPNAPAWGADGDVVSTLLNFAFELLQDCRYEKSRERSFLYHLKNYGLAPRLIRVIHVIRGQRAGIETRRTEIWGALGTGMNLFLPCALSTNLFADSTTRTAVLPSRGDKGDIPLVSNIRVGKVEAVLLVPVVKCNQAPGIRLMRIRFGVTVTKHPIRFSFCCLTSSANSWAIR